MKLNHNYSCLPEKYLFSDIAQRVSDYVENYPEQKIIRLGIGDVTQPLVNCAVQAMQQAAQEMGTKAGFHGYGPEQGYAFLRQAVQAHYAQWDVSVTENEIFISDGAKSDLANILGLFDVDNTVIVPNPGYPVYVDDNLMDGRKIIYACGTQENNFLPMPSPDVQADIIYLCSPNNPTGAAYTKAQLEKWVEYARCQGAVILYDAAYESFITQPDCPHSIYTVKGADTCAIEICSFSKIAGFTGMRCGYTVVPLALKRQSVSVNRMWCRRQTTKFNGVAYVIQRAAAEIFTQQGFVQVQKNLDYYHTNAKVLANALKEAGIWHCGGKNSPYIWMRCPNNMTSWQFFNWLLENCGIVGTPGLGFGNCGEGYFRLSAFGDAEQTALAAEKMRKSLIEQFG